jgi:death-on-curing protein
MTEGNQFLYLDREDYKRLHAQLAAWAVEQGEPIPSFGLAKEADLDALIQTPQKHFFGHVAYPTLEDKAAIIFYTINKRQIFLNGNKRMSTLALLVFLTINKRALDIAPDELTKKALWLANTESLEFLAIKDELARWIGEHLREIT